VENFIEVAFELLSCSRSYFTYLKSDYSKIKGSDLELLTKNKSTHNSNMRNGAKGEQSGEKSLYDICFDQVTFILLALVGFQEGEGEHEAGCLVIEGFLRHVRKHTKSSFCLPSHLLMYKLLYYSLPLQLIAKDQNLIQKLFAQLSKYYSLRREKGHRDWNQLLTLGAVPQPENSKIKSPKQHTEMAVSKISKASRAVSEPPTEKKEFMARKQGRTSRHDDTSVSLSNSRTRTTKPAVRKASIRSKSLKMVAYPGQDDQE